jgi:hypothetical protein
MRRADRRAQILDAATRAFARTGFAAYRLQSVCQQRIGVWPPWQAAILCWPAQVVRPRRTMSTPLRNSSSGGTVLASVAVRASNGYSSGGNSDIAIVPGPESAA